MNSLTDRKAYLILALVASSILPHVNGRSEHEDNDEDNDGLDGPGCAMVIGGGVLLGAGAVVFGIPALLGLAGFTAAGITKGSIAAGAMSMAANAGIGGAAVGVAQSVGAAGLSTAGTVLSAAAGGAAGYKAAGSKSGCNKKNDKNCNN